MFRFNLQRLRAGDEIFDKNLERQPTGLIRVVYNSVEILFMESAYIYGAWDRVQGSWIRASTSDTTETWRTQSH